tara:strand:- start:323 stop:1120 length:798 start_codon:yes stop_codon:yes gene_type:complete
MSINLSLSGQPFNGPDIGGFTKSPSPEVFANWIALGAYYPFSRNHTSNETEAQEPWAFGEEIEQVSRTAINRRYRLMPYLYTLFQEASQTGMPIMRPTFFADITDTSLRGEQQSFLLGEDLLITPQWAEDLKMPQGDWQEISLEENTDKYQASVKLRDGAIVPVGHVIQSTVDYSTSELTLFVNLDAEGKASGSLYDDAGEGYGYQSGDYAMLNFEATAVDGKVEVRIEQTEGSRTMDRKYKIALVQDGTVTYSEWQSGDMIRLN